MITGDSKEVACAVAKAVGLTTASDCGITGAEFETLSFEDKLHAVHTHSVFSASCPSKNMKS